MVGDYKIKTLGNGLRLLHVPMDTASVTVLILAGVGSRYETDAQAGLSHFLEHMAFKGTKNRPNTLIIASEIEAVGGEFNAYTSKDHTGYWIKAAANHLPLIVDVLADMLKNSLFETEEINREKGVIVEEINMYEDTPSRKVGSDFETLLYDKTALGREIIGTKQTVRAVNRQNFVNYLKTYYKAGNMVVAVVGGPKSQAYEKKTFSLLEKHFADLPEGKVPGFKKVSENQKKPALWINHKKSEQAHLCLGVRAIPLDSPKRYAMTLLTAILGGGMSSRLFYQVRERRGLAYYVRSETSKYQDVGNFVTQAGIDINRLEQAVQVILAEYTKTTETAGAGAISESELKKAKEFIKGRLILGLEDSQAVASVYATSLLLEGKIRTPETVLKAIEAVSLGQVRALAKEIFVDRNLNLTIIGPFKKDVDAKLRTMLKFS